MRKPRLRVVQYKHSATHPYCIEGYRVNGKRKRLFFETKSAANKELRKIKIKLEREGAAGLAVSDSLRAEASDCDKRLNAAGVSLAQVTDLYLECSPELAPFGKTIREATDFYLKYLREAERSISVSALADEFLGYQEWLNRSKRHRGDLKERLGRFSETFGDRPAGTITTSEIERWLHKLKLSAQSVNNFRARLAALFAYGEKRGYVEKNPVSAIDKIKLVDQPPEIFTPEQLQALLEKAPANLLPCIALGAFAGHRTAELLRLEWQDVDLKRGFVNVGASKSKTAKLRLIPISPNLAEWLGPYARRSTGGIYPFSARWYQFNIEQTRKAAGLSKWPNNGLRHSFASYHLASHQNAPQLALEMGHTTPRMIFDNYREVVTPEAAGRYWSITPKLPETNVAPMAGAGQ
jgi:integrase